MTHCGLLYSSLNIAGIIRSPRVAQDKVSAARSTTGNKNCLQRVEFLCLQSPVRYDMDFEGMFSPSNDFIRKIATMCEA